MATITPSEYTKKYEIKIDHSKIDSTLTNYPIKVLLTSTNFTFSQSLSTGKDIVFTDTSKNILDFEMVYFDSSNSLAEYHVKIASVSSTVDTTFYMYVGKSSVTTSLENPNSVWDSNFKAVYHLGQQNFANGIENFKLLSGTTGFSALYSSISVTNQVMAVTGNGDAQYPLIMSNKTATVGDKYFVYAKARVTNSDATQIKINRPFSSGVTITTPTINMWYEIYDIGDCDYGQLFYINHGYSSSAAANGKVMEIDGTAGIYVINMTEIGIEDYTKTEMYDGVKAGKYEDYRAKIYDSTSNSNDAISKNISVSADSSGRTMVFDGSAYVTLGAALDIGSTDNTISTLIKPPSVTTRLGNLLGNYSSTPHANWEMYTDGDLRLYWNAGEVDLKWATAIGDNTWHSVSFRRNETDDKFYADTDGASATLSSGTNSAGSNITFTSTHKIGADNSAGHAMFTGSINGLRISSISRSDAWIKADDYNLRALSLLTIAEAVVSGGSEAEVVIESEGTTDIIRFLEEPTVVTSSPIATHVIVTSPTNTYTSYTTPEAAASDKVERAVSISEGDATVCQAVADALIDRWGSNQISVIGKIPFTVTLDFEQYIHIFIDWAGIDQDMVLQKKVHNLMDFSTTITLGDVIVGDSELIARILNDLT